MFSFIRSLFRSFLLFIGVVKMTTQDLHAKSVKLGKKFAAIYRDSTDFKAIDAALDAYIESRRAIKRDQPGYNRYGAYEAYKATQGYLS